MASEVTPILGYEKGRNAVATHCKYAQLITSPNQGGNRGNPQRTIIPESDLYRLVIRSKLPAAAAFERWVMVSTQLFDFAGTPVTVITDNAGNPWWIANEVAGVLGIADPKSSMRFLDADEKGVHSMHTPGGAQEMLIINEPGLYSLILRSRKQAAKEFKRWVTHEVLPAIRKTGGYIRLQNIQRVKL